MMAARRSTWVAIGWWLAVALASPSLAYAQPPTQAAPAQGDVRDETGTLSGDTLLAIEQRAAALRAATGVRVGTLVVRDTAPESIGDFALRTFRTWGLGESTDGRAALLVVAVDARRNWIVVGSQLTGVFPEAAQQRVLREVFRPNARASGVDVATRMAAVALCDDVERALSAPPPQPTEPASQPVVPSTVEPEAPTDHTPLGVAFGGVGLVGLGAALAARRNRRRRAFEAARALFEAECRRYLELAERFPSVAPDAPAAMPAGYRTAQSDPRATIAPLQARVQSARTPDAQPQVDDALAQLRAALVPLERAESLSGEATSKLEAATRVIASLPAAFEQARRHLTLLKREHPTLSFAAEEQSLARAVAAAPSLEQRGQALRDTVASRSLDRLETAAYAAREFEREVGVVAADANAAATRRQAIDDARREMFSSSRQLNDFTPERVATMWGTAEGGLHARYAVAYRKAAELYTAGADPVDVMLSLRALEQLRHSISDAAAPPPAAVSYSASSYSSSSSDCARYDCASSDCASSDCTSSDCASSDCGGSGSDW